METVRIQNGATGRMRATALNADGVLLTGLTDMLIEIRRKSDGYYYDFSDTTFKNVGWTTRQQQMSELDATYSVGVYYYDFNTTGLSDDEYFIRVTSVTAINSPQEGELKVGGYVDDISTLLKVQTGRWRILSNQLIFYDIDDVTPLYTFNLKNSGGLPTENDVYDRVPV